MKPDRTSVFLVKRDKTSIRLTKASAILVYLTNPVAYMLSSVPDSVVVVI